MTALEAVFLSQISCGIKKDYMLTLGRQGLHISSDTLKQFAQKYNITLNNNAYNTYCENMFKDLGFLQIDSIDYSAYENASIIHDMNTPIKDELKNKYQYIYDGGTIEHIFNTPQVCENIINLLDIGGILLSVTCNNNLSGHGIYQFSPEFFLSAFAEKYGMRVKAIYLAEVNTEIDKWILCNSHNGWRNMTKFNNNNEVYIITIAEKLSNDRQSVITNSPQQFSYEHVDWKT